MGEEVFIDANIFLEIFLDGEKADACEQFIKSLGDSNTRAITTDFIIYSCFIIIYRNLKSPSQTRSAITFFANYSNLFILKPSFDDLFTATEIIDSAKLDFDDSLVIACMKSNGIKRLASLDKHFDKIKEIVRVRL